ncbi:MAG: S8 family peptidase, partial [Candidatus Kariarchaeaceae archaeon]
MNRKESLTVIVILLMSLFIPVGAYPDQIAVASSPASGNIIPTIHSSVVYAIFEYPEQLSSIDMPHIIYDNLNIVEIHTNNLDNLPSDLIYHRFNPQPLRFESNAVRYSLPELFEIVGLKPIHDAGNTGGSQYYVQIDDGIDSNHPSFQDRIVEVIDVSFPDAEECAVHGTAVAGVATAGIGVRGYETIVGSAPDAAIISYAVGCRNGSYGGNFLKAYNDAITKNDTIRVLNTSFGGSGVIVDQIIERLARSGILVVGSAGNKGPDYNSTGTGGPGNSIHALSVGSVINETTVADFSARGYAHNLQLKPDVVAPGVGINTTNSNEGRTHAVTSGTSISSPFVAGGILALLDALPDFMKTNPGLLKAAIMKGAKQIAEDQRIDGHGLVNFSRSLELILEAEQNEGVPLLVELT